MVAATRISGWRCVVALVAILAGAYPAGARADVFIAADRTTVQTNESFTLVLTADAGEGETAEPDTTGLDTHFDMLGTTRSSNVSIINGRRQATQRWSYVLLPKQAGEFEIGPLTLGGVSSNRLRVTVTPAAEALPGEADVFFEVSLDTTETWVQAEAIYTIKLFLGVAVRQNSLAEPQVSGGEMIVRRLGEDRRYDEQVGERLYTVIERNYALFAQSSGDYEIAPARFTTSLWERGRISTPRIFRSTPLSLTVRPTVAPPASMAGSTWLPAKALTLDSQVRPDDGVLDAGAPANVRLIVAATGLMGNQLPELTLNETPDLRVYPDQPDVSERALQTGMQSRREQSFAVIAGKGGVFDLQPPTLPWFNTTIGEWQLASTTLPTLRAAGVISAAAPAVAEQTPQAPPSTAEAAAAANDNAVGDAQMRARIFRLRIVNYTLLALWLGTLAWVWRSTNARARRRRSERRIRDQQAPFRATQKALKQVRAACDRNDAQAAHAALIAWARHYWPDQPTRTLGDIAARVERAEAAPIRALDRCRYRGDGDAWNGRELAAALSRLHRPGAQTRTSATHQLPPLFPSGNA
ncbi:MAG: BatD family protein [Pseudomonadota bacterium]